MIALMVYRNHKRTKCNSFSNICFNKDNNWHIDNLFSDFQFAQDIVLGLHHAIHYGIQLVVGRQREIKGLKQTGNHQLGLHLPQHKQQRIHIGLDHNRKWTCTESSMENMQGRRITYHCEVSSNAPPVTNSKWEVDEHARPTI